MMPLQSIAVRGQVEDLKFLEMKNQEINQIVQ